LAGQNKGTERRNENIDRIVPPALERAEDRHQNRLSEGSAVAAIAVDDLANQHRKTNFALAMIIGSGHFGMFQKGKQLIPIFLQAAGQALSFPIRILGQGQIEQAFVKSLDTESVAFWREMRPDFRMFFPGIPATCSVCVFYYCEMKTKRRILYRNPLFG